MPKLGMRSTCTLLLAALGSAPAWAQEAEPVAPPPEPNTAPATPPAVEPEPTADEVPAEEKIPIEELVDLEDVPAYSASIYGFIDTQYRDLAFSAGLPAEEEARLPAELREEKDTFNINLNVMFQGNVFEKYHWFLNLGALGAGDPADGDVAIGIRNAWVELPLYRERLLLRAGKTYRRFGLYNEILDAAPTFPGVEQPEFLVEGQLMLTRTTNVMLHGSWLLGDDRLVYTFHTGMDERRGGQVPLGGDLRYYLGDLLLVGASGYWSGGDAKPTRLVGEGRPEGGVPNWMVTDEFYVYGGYAQLTRGPLLFQVEYFRAHHDGQRNPNEVLKFAAAAELNERQRQRFVNGVMMPTAADVNVDAQYAVQTLWSRVAYEIELESWGTVTPYLHLDWYRNPESFEGVALGGNEAGLSDDGQFYRTGIGFVYRPVPTVALKLELNPHIQTVQDEVGVFSKFQASISYQWNAGSTE
jgi:hypothetical protein